MSWDEIPVILEMFPPVLFVKWVFPENVPPVIHYISVGKIKNVYLFF